MILATVCKLVLALGAGYYLNKRGIFTAEVNQKISWFVINICMPLVILTSLEQADGSVSKALLIKYILTGAVIYAALPFIGRILNVIFRIRKEDRIVYEQFYIFSNNLFMGYPISASIYGSGCIFQLSVFNLGFNLLYFTYGIGSICRAKGGGGEKFSFRTLLNTGTVASLCAILMFFTGLHLPAQVSEIFSFLGELSSPLSMVVIGSTIGTYSIRNVLTYDYKIYLVAAIRLLFFPVAAYVLMTALGFEGLLRGVAVISLGMPVASMVSMGCIEQNYQEELASAGVILTTLLSLPVIPVMLTVLS